MDTNSKLDMTSELYFVHSNFLLFPLKNYSIEENLILILQSNRFSNIL